ncbi:VPS10 domain-containing receptor SorCS1 isoform X2 [Aquarana catesbeiana]|uniref:VPS10 domain-containing receptor SorCS1 isoform X2 n=1 Tax=Aquarana catesbeiana TaxID=8400 RepID=UPI003CCA1E4E
MGALPDWGLLALFAIATLISDGRGELTCSSCQPHIRLQGHMVVRMQEEEAFGDWGQAWGNTGHQTGDVQMGDAKRPDSDQDPGAWSTQHMDIKVETRDENERGTGGQLRDANRPGGDQYPTARNTQHMNLRLETADGHEGGNGGQMGDANQPGGDQDAKVRLGTRDGYKGGTGGKKGNANRPGSNQEPKAWGTEHMDASSSRDWAVRLETMDGYERGTRSNRDMRMYGTQFGSGNRNRHLGDRTSLLKGDSFNGFGVPPSLSAPHIRAVPGRAERRAREAEGHRVTRAQAGDSDRVSRFRVEELKLSSTTFALTGDSAHNQAMVHWSGHNSSVILILTKLYDYNLGSITESSLWRSTDYGTTYEKLNDKVGLKTILSYLYVCPTNKRKIMLLTDPEIESSLLISSDEGATYQKYRLNFYIQSLLFHPKQEDWILAYSQDQKLFSSSEFGRRWLLLSESVAPNRFYWTVTISNRDAELVHLETKTAEGHAQYIVCKMNNCSENVRTKPFPGYIDTNSLIVQDEYVFVQLTSGGRPHYYVSYRREPFSQMKLPKYALPKDMHVISTDENQVFVAIQEWNQNETYNLYISDTRGIFFTLALENVKSIKSPEGNVMIDLYEVAGIKGMFLANKKIDSQVKTFITYNKGRDWTLLQAPDVDLRGDPVNCVLPYCSLHLHLKVSENPYTTGNIASRDTAPGIIVASGNIGSELTENEISMFISSDAGNTWRQIFEEEHSVLYLDQGGVLVAMKHTSLPIRHLWLSFDEGRSWSKYTFTSNPLFVDGVLGEPGEETLIMTVFGHFGHRSEWQLVKVDYKSIFDRRCNPEDYLPWQLHSQGEACIMGAKRTYMKRRSERKCMQGRYAGAMSSEPCVCTEADFECDYGYERHSNGQCLPAFWYNPSSLSKDCSFGQSYLNSTGYRKVVSNNCTDGVREQYTAKPQQCPGKAPHGLRITTVDGKLIAEQGHNVTFVLQLEEGDIQRTNIQVDFGDGIAVSYANLSATEDGIKHIYQNVGIFRVLVQVDNNLGSDSGVLYLHVTAPLEHIHLVLPFVTTKNKEVNASVVLWPSNVGTLTYVWWLGNNSEPIITLDRSISFTFVAEGMNSITVQVTAGNAILQDTKTIAVYEQFQSLRLSFSPNLDDYNPDIPEWRRDISRVIKRALMYATGINSKQILVAILPGLPTSAELFILPHQDSPGEAKKKTEDLTQIADVFINKLNQDMVHFELKPGVRIMVHVAHLTAAPLVDLTPSHSGSAMLMLLSVVFVGLAVFVIYKFKRKIPGINVYAQMQNEKEREMVSPGSQNESLSPIVTQTQPVGPQHLLEGKLEAQPIGSISMVAETQSTNENPTYVNV